MPGPKVDVQEILHPADEYCIEFDTRIDPPNIVATRVRLDLVSRDVEAQFRIDLCDHPLYPLLVAYVKNNPAGHPNPEAMKALAAKLKRS